MRFLRVYFSAILLTLATVLVAQDLQVVKPEQVGLSAERLNRIDQVFQGYVDNNQMSGSVILIARKGKIVYFKSFGKRDVASGSAMRTDAIFRIASQTKAIISVGIMMLQEEGKLLIADRLDKYIPEFRDHTVAEPREGGGYEVVKARRPITLKDLLTHTAGISYGNGPAADKWREAGLTGWYFADKDETIGESVARMAKLPMDAHPGERFIYGYNTDILGAVIERVSGQPLDVFLTERILKPLGMNDTHFYLPPSKTDRLATVYSAFADGIRPAPTPGGMTGQGAYVEGPRKNFSGGAGLLSTSMDYARFLQMLLNGGTLNGVRLLSPTSVHLMTVNHIGDIPFNDGRRFGLGFEIITDLGAFGAPGSEGTFGWGGAYGSKYWVDPKEELVVVYFKQLIPTRGLDDQDKLRTLVYQAIVE